MLSIQKYIDETAVPQELDQQKEQMKQKIMEKKPQHKSWFQQNVVDKTKNAVNTGRELVRDVVAPTVGGLAPAFLSNPSTYKKLVIGSTIGRLL